MSTTYTAASYSDEAPHVGTSDGRALLLIRGFNGGNDERLARYQEAIDGTRDAAHAENGLKAAESRLTQATQVLRAAEVAVTDRRRRSTLVGMWLLVVLGLVLDASACWLAAQVFDGDRTSTLIVTALLLAFLMGGEGALDLLSRRGSTRLWRGTLLVVALFVLALGLLRYQYLVTVNGDQLSALLGAALLTAITGGLVALGYLALRHAEPLSVHRCKREVARSRRASSAAKRRCDREIVTRDRRHDAYLSILRPDLLNVALSQEHVDELDRSVRHHLRCIADVPTQSGRR